MNLVRQQGQRNIKIIESRLFLSANCTSENESEFLNLFSKMLKPASSRKEKKDFTNTFSLLSVDTIPGFNR